MTQADAVPLEVEWDKPLAVLSQDIFKVASPELPKTVSVSTLVGGKIVHRLFTRKTVQSEI